MPYIDPDRRIFVLENWDFENPGELNFFIVHAILQYLEDHGESYENYNAIIGVLTCIQHELYRRLISDYEDEKIKENGDVY